MLNIWEQASIAAFRSWRFLCGELRIHSGSDCWNGNAQKLFDWYICHCDLDEQIQIAPDCRRDPPQTSNDYFFLEITISCRLWVAVCPLWSLWIGGTKYCFQECISSAWRKLWHLPFFAHWFIKRWRTANAIIIFTNPLKWRQHLFMATYLDE